MRIELYVGEGWNPFEATPNDEPLVILDTADDIALDFAASSANLAATYAGLVAETYPRDAVAVLPVDEEGGLCAVEFAEADYARLEELTAVPPAEFTDPEIEGPTLVAETVHGLLFEALQSDGWAVARS